MLKDKAMIIIAVSKYTGGTYYDLPGVITSAKKLCEWAKQPDEDCNYDVLYLADDVYEKIDVQLVREKIGNFVKNKFIDRLVVYFAGHGIVRSAGEQFWLLTDAAIDSGEGIDVESFKRGLMKCNIGLSNDDFAGQLCIIGDACRNITQDAIEFKGSSILTSTAKTNTRIQLDRFLSTRLGGYSFQINHTESQSAYCLFSEVMLSALRGEEREAIETQYHQFQPAVTNHKLSDYLLKKVSDRAAKIGQEMEPDLTTGIHPPYNFYKRLNESDFNIVASRQEEQLPAAFQIAPEGVSSNESLKKVDKRRKEILSKWERYILKEEPYRYFPTRETFCLLDFRPSFIAAPHNTEVEVESRGSFYEINAIDDCDRPILIYQNKRWLLIPSYPNVVSVVSHDLPGDILLLKTSHSLIGFRENRLENELWDTYLSDFSSLFGGVPLRAADAHKFADRIRVGKENYPHQSVVAGYLYEFSGDYENIARTAHYMARNTGRVPFDLALLCTDKIRWSKENGTLAALADLPVVEPAQENKIEDNRPYYTKRGFEELKNVDLLGIVPIFSQGWKFMKTELYLEIPAEIRRIGENISGRSAVSLTGEGFRIFLKTFDYRIINTDI